MLHFIRLTRPINLLVIAITMYGFGWYLEAQIVEAGVIGIQTFEFFILVFSTVLIAAAGNIINDYFDVRADRVNKPEKQIIGKFIKKRVAIVTHWIINFVAFLMAVYLSVKLNTFWYVFIHLLSINLLWFYSTYFKKKFLIGNVMIADLTAMVPILVGLYYYLHNQVVWHEGPEYFPFYSASAARLIVILSVGLGGFAFLLNLAREIAKDIQDVEGDRIIHARTVPIVWGSRNSSLLIVFFLLITIGAVVFVVFYFPVVEFISYIPALISLLFVGFGIIVCLPELTASKAKLVNGCLKLAMIFGTLSPVWWQIMKTYG